MLRSLVRCPPLRRLKRYVHDRRRRIEGLPEGLALETLDALCRKHGRGGVTRCSHLHLSGWKSLGTYRVELLTATGTTWRLIFKNECYGPATIPALEGLPIRPGPPEAALYRMQDTVLAPFLAPLLWFKEVEPGRHFQYLLGDLAETHTKLPGGTLKNHLRATRGLVQIQRALRQAFAGTAHAGLIRYDRPYSERLLDYAASNLAEYVRQTRDAAVTDLLDRWHDVVCVHQRAEFFEDGLRAPIHGDFNLTNLHFHRKDQGKLKVVDWEWAGVGLPHADLAALVKSVPPEHHAALLQAFVAGDRQADAEQQRRLFHWCRLERRLLDATFLARQQLLSPRRVPWMPRAISGSAGDVLAAAGCLGAGHTKAAA